jgi:hypothetical protein
LCVFTFVSKFSTPNNRFCFVFVTVVSDCTNEQRDYDQARENGTVGFTQLRPLCDAKGDYLPAHCIGGSMLVRILNYLLASFAVYSMSLTYTVNSFRKFPLKLKNRVS